LAEQYYPLFVRLEGVRVVVIGGGKVATQKVGNLLPAGAHVTVISPTVTEQLAKWITEQKVTYLDRVVAVGDVDGFELAFAATNLADINRRVASEAKACGCWVNVCDGLDASSFIVPSVVRRGHLTVAFSTDGSSPAVAKVLKEQLTALFGDEYEPYLEKLAAVRDRLKQGSLSGEQRANILRRIARSDVLSLIGEQRVREADALIERIIGEETADT